MSGESNEGVMDREAEVTIAPTPAEAGKTRMATMGPVYQIKLEALGKLDVCFKEFNEAFMKTKQAFQLYKMKSFFFPDPEFKIFTESIKQVEGELKEMSCFLSKLIDRHGVAEPERVVSNPAVLKTESDVLHNGSVSHTPEHSDVLAKANGTASITPPASEAGNDDEVLASVLDQGEDTKEMVEETRLGESEKKRAHKGMLETHSSCVVKRPRRSLIDVYMRKPQDVEGKKNIPKDDSKTEEAEYEVETIIAFKKSQGQYFYNVSWRGYGPEDNTWEPSENLTGCEEILLEFYMKRLKERESTTSDELAYQMMPLDTSTWHLIRKALLFHINHPSQQAVQNSIVLLVSQKPPVLKTQKEIDDLVDKALYAKKKDRYNAIVKILVEDRILRELQGKRKKQLAELRLWERNMNTICSDPAKLSVENYVDLELPPFDFIYINECRAGEGVTVPSDPVVGCECTDCAINYKSCCPNQMNSWFAYNKYGRLKVSLGTPVYECNKRCKCGSNCQNRVVQKGRTVSLCIFRTDNGRGWGVKTLENIKKDSLVTEYVGEIITSEEAERRGKIYDAQGCTYLFDLDYDKGDQNPYTIDAAKCGNVSHFINHSCDPNLVVFNVWVNCLDPDLPRLALFAVRDIKKGEELTFDYNSGLNSEHMAEKSEESIITPEKGEQDRVMPNPGLILKTPKGNRGLQYGKTECRCGAANCRKYFF